MDDSFMVKDSRTFESLSLIIYPHFVCPRGTPSSRTPRFVIDGCVTLESILYGLVMPRSNFCRKESSGLATTKKAVDR